MSNDDSLSIRMYSAAEQPDRGQRTPGAAQVMKPVLRPVTDSTPPPAASARPGQAAEANAKPAAGPSLAERMYPPTADTPNDTPAATGDALVKIALDYFTPQEVELLDREQSLGDRMAESGAVQPDSPDGYAGALAPGFDALQQEARETRNEADIAALAEGRKVAAELMHAMAVPTQQAKEVVGALSAWHGRELTDEQVEALGDRAVAELRAEWGKDFPAKVRMAQRAAAEATRKAPWLRDLWRTGAGNDPALIRHFAEIGLRNARKARRARK